MILHAVHAAVRNAYGAGNWKAVKSVDLLLDSLGVEWERVDFDPEDARPLFERCGAARHLLLEYSLWPELLRSARGANGDLRLYVRTHNAETLQYLHRHKPGLLPTRRNARGFYKIVRSIWRDMRSRQIADNLLGISEWDDRHYWRWLPGKARVQYLPYHCPWPECQPRVRPLEWAAREAAIVCMPGGRDPIGMTTIGGFKHAVASLASHRDFRNWRFLITGGVHRNGDQLVGPSFDLLEAGLEPWEVLCRVKAVALLTPLGFGFKTTILDALAAGCHPMVHPALARRLPANLSSLCLQCDPDQPDGNLLAQKLRDPPAAQGINRRVRQQALDLLRQLLGGIGRDDYGRDSSLRTSGP